MRPKAEVQIENDQHISEAARVLVHLLGDESHEIGDRIIRVRIPCLNQRDTARDRMGVRIDHARHQKFAVKIHLSCSGPGGLLDRAKRSDRDDLICADGERLGVRMVIFGGEDVCIVEHRGRSARAERRRQRAGRVDGYAAGLPQSTDDIESSHRISQKSFDFCSVSRKQRPGKCSRMDCSVTNTQRGAAICVTMSQLVYLSIDIFLLLYFNILRDIYHVFY